MSGSWPCRAMMVGLAPRASRVGASAVAGRPPYRLTLLLAFSALTSFAGDFLFKDGASDWKIVLPKEPSLTESCAAEELQTNLCLIGGVTLPVEKTDVVPTGKAIVIGGLGAPAVAARAKALGLEKSADDVLAMKTLDGNLYLAGNSPRAALFAVYHFLKAELGVRWFWQDEYGWDKIGRSDGTYRTKRARYELPKLDYRYQPRFRYREMSQCSWHGHVPAERWMLRQGLNCGCQSGEKLMRDAYVRKAGCAHSIGLNPKQFAEHPDWFALIDGKRTPDGVAGCWSNPEFFKAMVERHAKAGKDADLINCFIADVCARCQCPECTKEPDASSRFWNFYRRLADEIRKGCPDLRFAGLAYQEYRAVPKNADCSWLEYVEYCQYNRCYVHGLDAPSTCALNKSSLEELGRWGQRSKLAIYGYQFDIFGKVLFTPFWNMLAEEARAYAKNPKVVRMKTEMPIPRDKVYEDNCHVKFRIPYYVYAQVVWNPELTTEEILSDWCAHVYGAGAKPMFAYLTKFAAAWDALDYHPSYFGGSPNGIAEVLVTPELQAFAAKCFDEAEAAAKAADDARALKEIGVDRRHFGEWVKLWEVSAKSHVTYNLPYLPDAKDWSEVPRLAVRDGAGAVVSNVDLRLCWTDEKLRVRLLGAEQGATLRLETGDGKMRELPIAGKQLILPFAELTGARPKDGEAWKLSVVGKTVTGLFAYPSVDATTPVKMASVFFTEKCRGQRFVWVCSPHMKDRSYQSHAESFIKHGWNTECLRTREEAEAADYSQYDVIYIDSYQNKLSKECFREKIVPAVKNGALLFMSCYYWCEDLDQKFDDPTYKLGFKDDAATNHRCTWLTPSSFSTTPHKLRTGHTPCGVLFVKSPESWEVLAKQIQGSTKKELPYAVIRPCGKGAVLVTAGVSHDLLNCIDNAREYGRKIAAERK